ncbi:MAG: molybdopterin-dependent oxidoreductase [Myxococcota bacterium]
MSKREVRSFCRVCEPACGLIAEVVDGELTALRPDREHPVTKGFACHKGLAATQIHHDPDRLDFPMRRNGSGEFEPVSWDTAISEIGGKLRGIIDRHGPDSVASYIGNPTAFNTLVGPAFGAFFAQLGTRRVFSSGTQDCANKFAGSEAVFGSSTINPIPDVDHTDLLLIFGANPRISHWSFIAIADPMKALKDARKRGAKIVFVNPRQIESAPGVGEVLQIRPDTDVYLLAALLYEIDAVGGFDEAVIRNHGKHLDELRAFIRRYPAERAALVTGIAAESIRELAGEIAGSKRASFHMSTGVNMGRQGTIAYWLLHMLSFTTGNLDRTGGNLLSLGFYPNAKAGRRAYEDGFIDSPYGRFRKGSLPGNLMAHYITEVENPVRAMLVVAGNPALSIGGGEKLRSALESLELLVTIDLYRNATGQLADYVLPSADMYEREDVNITGLGLQHRPYIQFTERVVAPKFERREEWWIFAKLSQALGLRSPLDQGDTPDLWGRTDHMLRSGGHSLDAVRATEHGLLLPPLAETDFCEQHLQTNDNRVDCCPPGFSEAIERVESQFAELEAEGTTRLKLITLRDNYMHNSWYQNLEGMKRGAKNRNYLYVNPKDASERDLDDGAKVRVWNEFGSVQIEIRIDAGLMCDVVALTHGWGNARTPGMSVANRTPGVNSNALLPSGPGSFDPLSNQSFMTGVPVEVRAI